MFERFSEDARDALVAAQEEARALRHGSVGPEHLLLGVMHQTDPGFVIAALAPSGITVGRVRERVAELADAAEEPVVGQIPFTLAAKKVLERALREALGLGHNFIGTEHMLLAMLREPDDASALLLKDLGAQPEMVRPEVLRIIRTREYAEQRSPASDAAARLAEEAAAPEQLGADLRLALKAATAMASAHGRPPDAGDLFVALAETAPLPMAALATASVDIAVIRDAVAAARR